MTTNRAVKVTKRYLNIPIHNDAPLSFIALIQDGVEMKRLELKLAVDKVQSWFTWDADAYIGCELEVKSGNEVLRAEHFVFQSEQSAEERHLYGETVRPQFHYTARKGWIGEPVDFYREQGQWHVRYEHRLYKTSESAFTGHAVSKDLIHWHEAEVDYDTLLAANDEERKTLPSRLVELPVNGDVTQKKWLHLHDDNLYSVGTLEEERFVAESEPAALQHGNHSDGLIYQAEDGRCILVGFSRGLHYPEMPFHQQMLIPAELKLLQTEQGVTVQAEPVAELQNLRIWQRTWSDIALQEGTTFEESLHFRMAPADWPDVRILPAENKPDDITADALDVVLELEMETNSTLEIGLYGVRILLDTGKKTIACQDVVAPIAQAAGGMKLRLLLDRASLDLFACEGAVRMTVAAEPNYSERRIQLSCPSGGIVRVNAVAVYGLRSIWPSPDESRLIQEAVKDNTVVYQSDSYTVYSNRVEDSVYGEPPAYVPDRHTIVSPTRAIEEFVWRKNWANDMNRVIDRGNVWHPKPEISRLPAIFTGHATIDAAYNLAADIFYRCGSAEFARKGEEGMWTAGQFQGPGEGFGVWVRDTAHIAMRSGSILDPEGARESLLFTTKGGLDNGVDGMAMPIVGIWDYYLATGDLTLIKESWQGLKERITKLDGLFDSERGLIPADQATSNDAFPEPECAGFSLATEIYFMEAFRAMSRMGAYMGEPESTLQAWADRGELLLRNIQSQYWNEEAGFYTSGPVGSESYEQGYWESAGQEIAMWPRYGVASEEQRRSMLSRLPEVAMNEFGVNVFPYRPETNHFCNAAWVVWTSGMAAAAGREGRLDLLTTLIAQQVRNSVMNKTFYEVIDYQTGKAWRWPGQLWHAAGFISYFLLGVLGMEYDEQGASFAPAVPEMLRDLKVENLRYRKAVFDIVVHGWGTNFAMHCDGQAIKHIPADLAGKHYLEFWATT
ncbi:Glycosyl hydrolases family 32 N-terminal domain-containing protein [Paenibacillus sp. CF384]|nr:Glycosyl hydrolases family 32 N-terminal domain-containing protein [Paenibacillus sp. CF384]